MLVDSMCRWIIIIIFRRERSRVERGSGVGLGQGAIDVAESCVA